MGFQQYHEPANELSQDVRTFARIITSLTEETEAIDWYEQRISVEQNDEAKKIMMNAQTEEMKHFAMDSRVPDPDEATLEGDPPGVLQARGHRPEREGR